MSEFSDSMRYGLVACGSEGNGSTVGLGDQSLDISPFLAEETKRQEKKNLCVP